MTQQYFFNSYFLHDIDWDQDLKIRLGTVGPNNRDQFRNGLKKLSNESIRNRFLGLKKEFSESELSYLTEFDGQKHYALGLELREKPSEGIGVVRLVKSDTFENEAEIAITVIDAYQGRGIGSLLVKCAALAALERKVEKLHYSFLPQNKGIIKLMNQLGPAHTGFQSMDFVQNYIHTSDIDIEKIKSELRPYLPSIETFHS